MYIWKLINRVSLFVDFHWFLTYLLSSWNYKGPFLATWSLAPVKFPKRQQLMISEVLLMLALKFVPTILQIFSARWSCWLGTWWWWRWWPAGCCSRSAGGCDPWTAGHWGKWGGVWRKMEEGNHWILEPQGPPRSDQLKNLNRLYLILTS